MVVREHGNGHQPLSMLDSGSPYRGGQIKSTLVGAPFTVQPGAAQTERHAVVTPCIVSGSYGLWCLASQQDYIHECWIQIAFLQLTALQAAVRQWHQHDCTQQAWSKAVAPGCTGLHITRQRTVALARALAYAVLLVTLE